MENTYNDDPNRAQLPIQRAPQSSTFMDYIRQNKIAVLIIIVVIIALLWWFCMRKSGTNIVVNTPVPVVNGNGSNPNVKVVRSRGSLY